MIPTKPRFCVFVDGKWQGGSFAEKAEAEAVGAKLCHGTSNKFEVRPKGAPEPKPEPKK